MSRLATVFGTLRGWSWLCAAGGLVTLPPFAVIVWHAERDAHAQLAAGGVACGTGFMALLLAVHALACGLGILAALFGAGSFLRLPAPRAAARRWELLLAASAPLTLPAIHFVAMVVAGRLAAA